MAKYIKLTIIEDDISAIAELLEEEAPLTCEALWCALEIPIIHKGIHAMWTGREIMVEIPEENHRFDPSSVPLENATIYPLPGDIMWAYFPDHVERGFPRAIWDFIIIYGPDSSVNCALGTMPANVWAHITDNLTSFANGCASLRSEGMKTFRIERLESHHE
jgi:hypothetical protein